MRVARVSGWVAGMFLLAAIEAPGQEARPVASGSRSQISAQVMVQSSRVSPADIVREIDDPHTGDRWLLMRDASHPGGPGRLLLVSAARIELRQTGLEAETVPPVIRTGDRVIVEENTAVLESRLEAIALSPAIAGSALNVRLILGGKVVRVVAAGPGRAVFQGENQR